MDAMERMPGDAEAAAAIAALRETAGHGFAIGDRLSYRRQEWGGGYEPARVVGFFDEGQVPRLIVEHEDGSGIAVIDPREFPIGNVLPF
jgi:hypothetical protein